MNRIPQCVAVAAVLAALAVGGCDARTDTNGLETKSAAEVQQDAAAALKGAKSVHVTSKGTSEGKSAEFDMRIQGNSSSGTLTIDGASVEIARIGEDVFIKGDEHALGMIGAPPSMARGGADKWIKLKPDELTSLEGFSLDDVAAQLTKFDSPLEPKVEQTTLDRRKVVLISQQNGSKLYVANTGPAYPLHGEIKGENAGQTDFGEYGADFRITAPTDAIDAEELESDETGPPSAAELSWLESIGAARKEIDEAYRLMGNEYDESEVRMLANTLRGCTRGIAQTDPPSDRLRPVHDLVKQACQEYDKGADCLESAVKIWNVPAGNDEAMNKVLDCGLAAQNSGGQLLGDAMQEGVKIGGTG